MALKNKHKNTYLSFRLGKEIFAISVKKVLEVLQKQYITEMPEMPEYIKGVINFRGDILPVVDARVKFKMKTSDLESYVIIVLEITDNDRDIRVCALVDSVKDVISVDDHEIKPIPEMGLKYSAEYLNGMIKSAESFITILNVDKIFTSQQINQLLVDNEN
jgi:purine-binding chemotaxis protein CheW